MVDRRGFLKAAAGAGAVAALGAGCSVPDALRSPAYDAPPNGTAFTLGVASGLQSPTAVVLWTRPDPTQVADLADIGWELYADPELADLVTQGSATSGPDTDYCVKVLVDGLAPDTSYWYRFVAAEGASPVGRARTLPAADASPDSLRLAFCSCQAWGEGWYNAWAGMAAEDVDAVVFLGDYIYESAGATPGRDIRRDTAGDAVDLPSYRAKYRLYRSDPLLQRAHAAHPFVPIRDDHEVSDNYNSYDATIGQPARTQAAYRTWFEYMPVMPIDGTQIYRTLGWGDLGELFLLDTRQYRDIQAGGEEAHGPGLGAGDVVAQAVAPGRSIMGATQRQWLLDNLDESQSSGVAWKLIANQVMISPVRPVDLDTPSLRRLDPEMPEHNGVFINMDSWDSYQWERDLLLGHLADGGIADVAFLTGDIHSFWQSTLRADYDDPATPFVANEFVGGAISSAGPDLVGPVIGRDIEFAPLTWDPPFRYVDFRRNGYGIVECDASTMTVSYRTCDVLVLGAATSTSVTFRVNRGDTTPSMQIVTP